MSTRATYQFKGYLSEVTIYHHCEGYLSGAAILFANAMKVGERLTAESFIRGNERAEITESHEIHGDTEYRYNIVADSQTIHVSERVIGLDWREIGSAKVEDFITVSESQKDHITAIRELKKLLESSLDPDSSEPNTLNDKRFPDVSTNLYSLGVAENG
jgi:hypothetical protein